MEPCSTSGIENIPSRSVIVPVVVPFIATFAPVIGSPWVSFTCPLTVSLWANTNVGNNNRHNRGMIPLQSRLFGKMLFIR